MRYTLPLTVLLVAACGSDTTGPSPSPDSWRVLSAGGDAIASLDSRTTLRTGGKATLTFACTGTTLLLYVDLGATTVTSPTVTTQLDNLAGVERQWIVPSDQHSILANLTNTGVVNTGLAYRDHQTLRLTVQAGTPETIEFTLGDMTQPLATVFQACGV